MSNPQLRKQNWMEKYRIHIKDDSPENVAKELIELSTIMDGLRHYSKIWKDHFGAENRKRMKFWEDKADEWIEKHKQPIL